MLLSAQYSIQVSQGYVVCIGVGTMRDSSLYGTTLWNRDTNLFINYVESPNDVYAIWEITLAGKDAEYVIEVFNVTGAKLSAIQAALEIVEVSGYKQAIREGTAELIWQKPEFRNFKSKVSLPIAWGINNICIDIEGQRYRLLP